MKRNPNYEKTQKEQNKDLGDILKEHEGTAVLLSESNSDQAEDREPTLIDELDSFMVRDARKYIFSFFGYLLRVLGY